MGAPGGQDQILLFPCVIWFLLFVAPPGMKVEVEGSGGNLILIVYCEARVLCG